MTFVSGVCGSERVMGTGGRKLKFDHNIVRGDGGGTAGIRPGVDKKFL